MRFRVFFKVLGFGSSSWVQAVAIGLRDVGILGFRV